MKCYYYMQLRIFLLAILMSFFDHSIILAQETGQKSEIKFGPKIGWHPFLWCGHGLSTGQAYTMGFFTEYTSRQAPRAFANTGIEIGLFYSSAYINAYRGDIDPIFRSRPLVGCVHKDGTIPLSLKRLTMPILGKLYLGKCNKFCYSIGFYISCILTAKKEDPRGEFRKTSTYALLDEKDKDHITETYKKAYAVFNSEWQKRENKYTPLSVKDIFPALWCLGFNMGIQYEMDIGLALSCAFLWEVIGMQIPTVGLTLTLGYNLNRILKWS